MPPVIDYDLPWAWYQGVEPVSVSKYQPGSNTYANPVTGIDGIPLQVSRYEVQISEDGKIAVVERQWILRGSQLTTAGVTLAANDKVTDGSGNVWYITKAVTRTFGARVIVDCYKG